MKRRKAVRLIPIVLLALLGVQSVQAERCWSSGILALDPTSPYSGVGSGNMPGSWYFIDRGAGFSYALSNCNSNATNNAQATPFGPSGLQPTTCQREIRGSDVVLEAAWVSLTAKFAAGTQAGCEFTCGGKSCRMYGGDGLPVELMSFSVDDAPRDG